MIYSRQVAERILGEWARDDAVPNEVRSALYATLAAIARTASADAGPGERPSNARRDDPPTDRPEAGSRKEGTAFKATHLTPKELAARLHRSLQTIANWRVQGRGPRYIPGRPVLYPIADLEVWEREQTVRNTLEGSLRRADRERATKPKR